MAYAAVTSLMETLSLHFLQSKPRLPLDDLEAQIRDGNENLGLLQQILEDEASSNANETLRWVKACLPRLHGLKQSDYPKKKKKMVKSEKQLQLAENSSQNERIADAGENVKLLFSHLKLLRVLDMRGRFWDGVIDLNVLANLVHLRYLALSSTYRRSKIKLFEHWNMQSLIVGGNDYFYNFVHLEQLEKLSIRGLMDLKLISCSIPWPTSLLPNLKKLNFLNSYLKWSELSLISMLPNLEVLKLIDACIGLKWETSDGGFHRLKRLVIERTGLQYWNAAGDNFPVLECLEINECYWLEEIPRGFADITTLALIQIRQCRGSLVTSAKWIQDEQNNNYGNDALLVRLVCFYPFDISLTI
nr:putative late blight resistance protein homolog R1A-10 isoform X1 [Ipomoea batatas]